MLATWKHNQRKRIITRSVIGLLVLLLTGLVIWLATEYNLSRGPDEVLVCNGADCSWFPAHMVTEEDMAEFCVLTEDVLHPAPYWDCPLFGSN